MSGPEFWHMPCVVVPAEEGQALYGRRLAGGKNGPLRPRLEEDRRVLLSDPEEDRGENEGRLG